MTDDTDDHQPPLTLDHRSFTRGRIEDMPCVVVYDQATDKTTVIADKSKGYDSAIAAISVLEFLAEPIPAKTVLHKPRAPKLILPGSNASN